MTKIVLALAAVILLFSCNVSPLTSTESAQDAAASSRSTGAVTRIADGSYYESTWYEEGPMASRIIHVEYGFWTDIQVQNLTYAKTIGIVYTLDNWATNAVAYGSYEKPLNGGYEQWGVDLHKLASGYGRQIKYAIFATMNGATYWDNNNGQNYAVNLF